MLGSEKRSKKVLESSPLQQLQKKKKRMEEGLLIPRWKSYKLTPSKGFHQHYKNVTWQAGTGIPGRSECIREENPLSDWAGCHLFWMHFNPLLYANVMLSASFLGWCLERDANPRVSHGKVKMGHLCNKFVVAFLPFLPITPAPS